MIKDQSKIHETTIQVKQKLGMHTKVLLGLAMVATLFVGVSFAAASLDFKRVASRDSSYRLPILPKPVKKALTVRINTVDPTSSLVIGQQGGIETVGKFTLYAKDVSLDISSMSFEIIAPDGGIVGGHDEIDRLYVYKGISPVGFKTVTSNVFSVDLSSLTIPARGSQEFTVKASFAELNREVVPAESGAGLKFKLNDVDAKNGGVNVPVYGLGNAFNTFTSVKSLPLIFNMPFNGIGEMSTTSLTTLYKFGVTATSSPAGLYKFSFNLTNMNVNLDDDSFILFESDTTANFGNIIAKAGDFDTSQLSSSGGILEAYLDPGDNNPVQPGKEHRVISAFQTKYYVLRGIAVYSQPPDDFGVDRAIFTKILNDSWFAGNQPFNANEVDNSEHDNFIWSDLNFALYSTSTAPSTEGWFNSFRVPHFDYAASYTQLVTQ